MVARLSRVALAMLLPFLLTGCLLAPGKFVARLSVDADRSFSFSYVGEVIALDLGKEMGKGLGGTLGDPDDDDATPSGFGDGEAVLQQIAWQGDKDAPDKGDGADKAAESEARNKAIAEALAKEAGYRKVTYQGGGKFLIDYAISGTLTHAFVWPFNIDAEIVFPFIALEVRGNGTVRVNAPAFANDGTKAPGADQISSRLDGVFTLDTDAEIVSQNSEDGAAAAGGRKAVTWKATPLSKTAPLAVLRMK